MNNLAKDGLTYIDELRKLYQRRIIKASGLERAWNFINWTFLEEGYYSPDELIDLSLHNKFFIDFPFCKIKRRTKIAQNVIITNNTTITGENVSIGKGTILDGVRITGSDIEIGEENVISGLITPGNLKLGKGNVINGLFGENKGKIVIGNHNKMEEVRINNAGGQCITIGDFNELHRGLNINCMLSKGRIRIGHYNSLGRDGGGVISNAYWYNRRWWGDVLIGSHIETTRGAEILGFSLLGWPLSESQDKTAKHIFANGPVTAIITLFDELYKEDLSVPPGQKDKKDIGLFGVVKVKMSCLLGTVKIKDNTIVQSSYLRDVIIQERCKIFFTTVNHNLPNFMEIPHQGRAIDRLYITEPMDWSELPHEPKSFGFREEDGKYLNTKNGLT